MYINKKRHTSSRFARLRAVSKLTTFFIHPVYQFTLCSKNMNCLTVSSIIYLFIYLFIYMSLPFQYIVYNTNTINNR